MTAPGLALPESYRQRVRATWPDEGQAWLDALPGLLASARDRWGLSAPRTHADLTFNYIEYVTGPGGESLVLKAGVPDREMRCQVRALGEFSGRGGVRVLESDPEAGLLLLDRALPGDPLTSVGDDDERSRIAAELMKALHRGGPRFDGYPTVSGWASRTLGLYRSRFGSDGPIPPALIEEAALAFKDLLAPSDSDVLLHGDLHHDNVLRSGEGWVVIDPKGVVGPREYECGPFLYNPRGFDASPDLREKLQRRIAIFADELGFEPGRVRRFGFAAAMVSALWSTESDDDPGAALRIAEAVR